MLKSIYLFVLFLLPFSWSFAQEMVIPFQEKLTYQTINQEGISSNLQIYNDSSGEFMFLNIEGLVKNLPNDFQRIFEFGETADLEILLNRNNWNAFITFKSIDNHSVPFLIEVSLQNIMETFMKDGYKDVDTYQNLTLQKSNRQSISQGGKTCEWYNFEPIQEDDKMYFCIAEKPSGNFDLIVDLMEKMGFTFKNKNKIPQANIIILEAKNKRVINLIKSEEINKNFHLKKEFGFE